MRVTLKNINKAIKAAGGTEELVRGNGYFYFVGDDTPKWERASVYTMFLSDFTVDEWVAQWRSYRDEYATKAK
jgi:hypothetical protein